MARVAKAAQSVISPRVQEQPLSYARLERFLSQSWTEMLNIAHLSHLSGEDQHKVMKANGCGPQGLVIKEPFGLYRCCNSEGLGCQGCHLCHLDVNDGTP